MHTLKIGWGRRDIAIDEPVSIPGQAYMRISQKILDPLYATALCIDGGQEAVIFCTCDTISIRNNVTEPIRELVHSMRPDLPTEAIILCATHTHTCPTTGDTPQTTPDGQPIYPGSKYRAFFIRQAADAIVEAWDNRAEGGFSYGYGYAVVSHSRRVVYRDDFSLRSPAGQLAPNGRGVMYGNTADDQFSHYEAGADHFLNAMFTFDKENKLTGIVVNVPCPSQIGENLTMLSADYWHDVRQAVAKEFGENVYVLPQCAAAGDLSPRILHYKQAQARRMALKYGLSYDPAAGNTLNKILSERYDIAQRILEGLRDIYSWAKKDIQTQVTVTHKTEVLQLPKRMITDQEKQWCEDTIRYLDTQLEEKKTGTPEEIRKAVSIHTSITGRNKRAIAKWEAQKNEPDLPMECHVVRIGDMAFATNRFELYMDFMHRIQARSPFTQTFVVQLAGSEGSTYLPTERGVQNKGYSASIFCNVVGPEGGQVLVEETVRMLKELHG